MGNVTGSLRRNGLSQASSGYGRWVRGRRMALGINQRELGEMVGVTHGHIGGIESGARTGSESLRKRLASILHPKHQKRVKARLAGKTRHMTAEEEVAIIEEMVGSSNDRHSSVPVPAPDKQQRVSRESLTADDYVDTMAALNTLKRFRPSVLRLAARMIESLQ